MNAPLFACPRTGCYAVVPRLTEISVSDITSLTWSEFYICDECLAELRSQGPELGVTETGRGRGEGFRR